MVTRIGLILSPLVLIFPVDALRVYYKLKSTKKCDLKVFTVRLICIISQIVFSRSLPLIKKSQGSALWDGLSGQIGPTQPY